MDKKFFSQLRTKLSREPDKSFDNAFWTKFNNEFSQERIPVWEALMRILAPAGAALALMLLVWTAHNANYEINLVKGSPELTFLVSASRSVEELEMFLDPTLEEVGDLSKLDDSEWDILLGKEESG